jgi:hypothetical protein
VPVIQTNLTPSELTAVKRYAQQMHLSIGQLVRRAVNDYVGAEVIGTHQRGGDRRPPTSAFGTPLSPDEVLERRMRQDEETVRERLGQGWPPERGQ